MLRLMGMGTALAVLAITHASAADNMANFYGNTVVCTYPGGKVTKVYTQPAGAFTVVRDGQTINGKWVDDGSTVCYSETDPAPPNGTRPVCVPSKPFKVGDGWTATDPTGASCSAILTAGHQ